jgi:hypothetical protein
MNLKNFELSNNLDYNNIIDGIPKNVIVCINETKSPVLYQIIENLNCSNIYCSDDWYIHQKKLNKETNECFDDCNNYVMKNVKHVK